MVQVAEDRSNLRGAELAIVGFPHDTATWGVLTHVTLLIEEVIKKEGFGSQRHREAMINLSKSATWLLDWLRSADLPIKEPWLRWTPALSQASMEAEQVARNYQSFVMCFTMWHKNRMGVEVLSRRHLRFTPTEAEIGSMQHRVRAYQQGVRRPNWPSTPDSPPATSFVEDPEIKIRLQKLCQSALVTGALSVEYPTDRVLLDRLNETYFARLEFQFRHNSQFDLGGYTLEQYRRFFAALMAVSSVHEHFCFLWEQFGHRYPSQSAILVKTVSEWASLLSSISNLPNKVIEIILSDMTFGTIRPLEIYIHPFFPSANGKSLYLAPQFIMNSRAEENILRTCSYLRPRLYSNIANAKEGEMRKMIASLAPSRFRVIGPVKLPSPYPDIDLLMSDRESSHVLIGELKWTRKTIRAIEHIDRDEELHKGFKQLGRIQDFLNRTPDYLQHSHIPPNPILSYALIGRDHLVWIEPEDNIFLIEFDALLWMFQNSDNLQNGINQLRKYDWLPIEGIDFFVRHERATVTGITIETEVFHQQKISGHLQ
ncbi:MAG TPA: hypothetical protein VIJ01_14560 [Candidatus Angelobacter sp.]